MSNKNTKDYVEIGVDTEDYQVKRMNTQIRQAAIEDLSELCSFSRDVFYETFNDMCSPADMDVFLDHAYDIDKIRGEFLDPDSSFFLLYRDGMLAGYIKVNEAPAQTDIHDTDALELERINASPNVQGTGLGSYLMEQVIGMAKQRGKQYIWLGVWERHSRGISFYRKHGFYVIGTHTFVVGNDPQTDHIMRRDL